MPLLVGGKVDRLIEPRASSRSATAGDSWSRTTNIRRSSSWKPPPAGSWVSPSPRRSFPSPSSLGGPKWEGMARDSEGNIYLIGAHVGKTDEERTSKSVLLRFRISDGDSPAIDDASVLSWHIARSLEAN